jgi:hypothetical protein
LKLLDTEILDSNLEERPDITEVDVDLSLEIAPKLHAISLLSPDSKLV